MTGSVAKSTHSGLPWLRYLRKHLGNRIRFWPFEGWQIPVGMSVVAEVCPALWSAGFPAEDRDPHRRDAYCVAETLRRSDLDDTIKDLFEPKLASEDRRIASIEG